MEVYNSTVHGTHGISTPHRMPAAPPASSMVPAKEVPQDSVHFSEAARSASLEALGDSSSAGVRFDLVNRIKREIAAGTYDTPDKMDIAIDRLMANLRRG